MRNINTNRISATITPAMVNDSLNAINTIAGNLSFLISLSAEERKGLVKASRRNKDYSEDAYAVAAQHQAQLPPHVSLDEMGKDINGSDALKKILDPLEDLVQKIRDTRMLMNAEAYMAALAVYQALDNAFRNGVADAGQAHTKLSDRFKRRSSANPGKGGAKQTG